MFEELLLRVIVKLNLNLLLWVSMEIEEEQEYSELLQEIEQQFLCYKEKSNRSFQEIEKAISTAAQMEEILT